MRKAIPMLSLLTLLFSSMISAPNSALGATDDIKQIEQDRKQVQSNLSKKEKQIVKVLEEIEALYEDIQKTEQELAEHNKHIAETEEKIIEYEEDFHQLIETAKELNDQINTRTDILNKQLAAYQKNGGDISYLEVLFNAKSFLDFISRVSSVSTITGAERELIEEQINDKLEIEEIQETIVEKIEQQEELIEDLEDSKTYMDEKQANLKKSEKKLKQKEKKLKKEKNKLSKEDSDLKQVEETYRNRMEARKTEQKQTVEKVSTTNSNKQSSSNSNKQSSSNTNKQSSSNTNNKSSPSTSKSTSTNKLNVGETLRVEATAYTANCTGCSGVTSRGINLKSKNAPKVIAVDPSVIPLGSRVWVEGYGEAIAGDTGGAIKGKKIDVFVKSKSAARQWGRRTVTVKILK